MKTTIQTVLVVTAFILTILAMIRPSWPMLPVAVLLICVDLMIDRA